jgi:hypothetical protein
MDAILHDKIYILSKQPLFFHLFILDESEDLGDMGT